MTILVGETGSGKTTQVPQFLQDAGYTNRGVVGITQPRRVAAVSVASRVADEVGCSVGDKVGYQIRFVDYTGPNTVLRFMTDGMLVREAILSTEFSRYSVIILDEVHERSLHTDILLGLIKQALAKRSDLKLIVMSATMVYRDFVKYFGDDTRVVQVPGRTHKVELYYTPSPEPDFLEAAMICIMQIHMEKPSGDVLVFLPGQEDIEGLNNLLLEKRKLLKHHDKPLEDLLIAPIFAALPFDEQVAVFEKPPAGTRKVVLATNIAETSITISGIKYIVDTGLVKLKACHPSTGIEVLKLSSTSKAAANQRSGRAGREGPGEAYRLYIEEEYNQMIDQTPPEIVRVDMATCYLQLKALNIDVLTFPFMDAPDQRHLTKSAMLLLRLGALSRDQQLTELGKRLAVLPLHPLYAKAILISDEFECVAEMLSIVAMLSTDSLFYQSKSLKTEISIARKALHHPDGDHLTLLNIYKQWAKRSRDSERRAFCGEVGLNHHAMMRALNIRDQLKDLLPQIGITNVSSVGKPENWFKVRQCLLKAMFVNVAKLDDIGGTVYTTIMQRQEAKIHPHSSLFQRLPMSPCILYSEFVTTSKNYLRTCTVIDPSWLLEIVPEYFAKV